MNLLTISDKIGSHFLAHEHGYRKSVASNPYVLCRPEEKQRGKKKERRGGRCEWREKISRE